MKIKSKANYSFSIAYQLSPVVGFIMVSIGIDLQLLPSQMLPLILPICWSIAWLVSPLFRPDLRVLTPKNTMLFIWFNKLVIIPLELFFVGNKATLLDSKEQPIVTEIFIIVAAFWSFWIGWLLRVRGNSPSHSFKYALGYGVVWCLVGLCSIIFLYGSPINYWLNAIFTYATYEALYNVGGTVVGFLANIGQRFWAFGIILLWYSWQKKYNIVEIKDKVIWYSLWLLACLLGSLSSNRSNMLYPILAFLSVMASDWYLRNKWWLVLLSVSGIFIIFFFGYVRVQPTLDSKEMGYLFDSYLSDLDYILYAHQLYFGTPYQITPLLYIDNPPTTIWASLLDPVPLIGKSFREESGSFVYNMSIYNSDVSQDKVIPVAGELYFNGGFLAVIGGHILFGYGYHFLDQKFKQYLPINLPVAAVLFYLSLLFSATLLLSFSVLIQFLLYNALPALLLIGAYKLQKTDKI